MTETAHGTTKLHPHAPTIDDLDNPLSRLEALTLALRVVCTAVEEDENDLRNAVKAIQHEMAELTDRLRRDYELIVPSARAFNRTVA